MDSEHQNLLFCTKVPWLSRKNRTDRVFELRQELKSIFSDQGKNKWYPVSKITILFSA